LVVGGGLVGLELAEHLAAEGREVVVVELLDDVARDMEPVTRAMTLKRLATLPVDIHTRTRLLELENGAAHALDEATGEERPLGRFDTVLVAGGHAAYDPLSTALREAGVPVTTIGDAVRPGQVLDATRAGREAVVAAERR
jgi:pyruvate/2-oxoglutarate dehydrogenase complex dihydrolipoamide dehydrogenase (E3) component